VRASRSRSGVEYTPPKPITTINDLRQHLQWAMELEHATIPPYFAAWVSIEPGSNQASANIIRSVMLEEMLHLTLAANLLSAVGGTPRLCYHGFVPSYPTRLPHSSVDFEVSIEAFSRRAIGTFLKIERPEPDGGAPQPDHYLSIGQFYEAIGEGIDRLCVQFGEARVFNGDERQQVQPEDYYGAGNVVVVADRASAHTAIAEIITQGEGADRSIFDNDARIFGEGNGREIAHYYRFKQIELQRRYTQSDTPASGPTGERLAVDYTKVFLMPANARIGDIPPRAETRARLEQFSASYAALLRALEGAFSGQRGQFTHAIAGMFSLRDQALALMKNRRENSEEAVGLAFEPSFPPRRAATRSRAKSGGGPVHRGSDARQATREAGEPQRERGLLYHPRSKATL
jgi:hypothetical protein